MADPIVISRVTQLPTPLVKDTVYFIKPTGSDRATIVIVGNSINDVGHLLTHAEMDAAIADAVASLSSVFVVPDIESMSNLTVTSNALAYVNDTSGDPGATGDAGAYVYDVAEDIWLPMPGTLRKVIEWDSITGRPVSSVEDIDAAVAWRHLHPNEAVLNNLNEVNGQLVYSGDAVTQVYFDEPGW